MIIGEISMPCASTSLRPSIDGSPHNHPLLYLNKFMIPDFISVLIWKKCYSILKMYVIQLQYNVITFQMNIVHFSYDAKVIYSKEFTLNFGHPVFAFLDGCLVYFSSFIRRAKTNIWHCCCSCCCLFSIWLRPEYCTLI